MEYDNTNTGIVSKNDNKTEDWHPDIKGKINVNGQDFWLDGWLKERKDGSGRFYSLRVKPVNGGQKAAPAPTRHEEQKRNGYVPNDDIPF